jgi:hypothetical protein
MHLLGRRLLDRGIVLQQDADRALQAHGFLRGGARALAPDLQRHHEAGEQHHVAHRQDDDASSGSGRCCFGCGCGWPSAGGVPPCPRRRRRCLAESGWCRSWVLLPVAGVPD